MQNERDAGAWYKPCEYCDDGCPECGGIGGTWSTERCTLADAPVGLFWFGDTLAMKSEYGDNRGRIDAYIVSSGEFFWGSAPQSIASQRASLVLPIDTDTAANRLATRPPAPEDAGTVERVARAVRAEINRQDGWSGSINEGEIARAAIAALSRLDGEAEK